MSKSQRNFVSKLFHSRLFYLVNMILVILIGISFAREMIHRKDISSQILGLQKQAEALQSEQQSLLELKDAVQTKIFIESEARLKLGLQKPGESLVIVKGIQGEETIAAKGVKNQVLNNEQNEFAEGGDESLLANSTKWWYYFFHKQAYRQAM